MSVSALGRRLVLWRGTDAWRGEAARIELADEGVRASGTQLGASPLPYRLEYRLDADAGWVTTLLEVRAAGDGWSRSLRLARADDGRWSADAAATGAAPLADPGGEAAPLAGALDCDLGLSPLTNLMPIRRHRLHAGPGAVDLLMAWVSVPDLAVHASPQRYEHVRVVIGGGAIVRYVDRGAHDGFTAEIELDREGVVHRYPGLAERVE